MTHPKLKIFGSIAGVALGVVLGWLSLEWLLHAIEGDDVRLVSENLGEKLWVQLKFAILSSLIGLSVFWGAIVSRRWNFWARLSVLAIIAIGAQWAIAALKWMHIASISPDGTQDMPAAIFLGDLETEWVPLVTAVLVWGSVLPLLFVAKVDPKTALALGDAEKGLPSETIDTIDAGAVEDFGGIDGDTKTSH